MSQAQLELLARMVARPESGPHLGPLLATACRELGVDPQAVISELCQMMPEVGEPERSTELAQWRDANGNIVAVFDGSVAIQFTTPETDWDPRWLAAALLAAAKEAEKS